MITTHVTAADIQDGLSLLMICDNCIAMLAVFECLAQVPQELATAVWESLPQEKYQQFQQWAIELLIDSDIVRGELFCNGLSPVKRVLTGFKALPPNFKKQIWSEIPSSRQQELRLSA